MSIKRRIKELLPHNIIYIYSIVRLFPKYVSAIWKSRNESYPLINFYTDEQTVDLIIHERKSLSRFGDGEFLWMNGEFLDSFQTYSDKFSKDLIHAFQSKDSNLLIGIPYGIVNSTKCNIHAKMHWKIMKSDFYKRIVKFSDLDCTYVNASITRPYIDYTDYEFSKKNFENLKRIWDKKDIVFVEGEKTKLGMGNDLFDNAKSIKRIICPSINAYESKDKIKRSILNNVSIDTMIIAALGPTASILASEMTEIGYQFIDIGHVDIEYMWFLRRTKIRESIDGKYVNESGKRSCSDLYDNDIKYRNSVIDIVL
ncbi:GT-D fold domain-containing glycosyltransferase [Clostridium perfringens]|uniref:GT-D fold domain-containing glycosyltransferase n=1 Tax=Clostridium perfringens TaxID=1502 RepID=UPI001CCA7C12|nr:GT-D fold domain-containing glycosyltransferase [Clostridium perfringens]UBK35296.1 DUF1792 domain-containing protein [Clostridium perfringens]